MLMNQGLEQNSLSDSPISGMQKSDDVCHPDDEKVIGANVSNTSGDGPCIAGAGKEPSLSGGKKKEPAVHGGEEMVTAPRRADVLLGRGKPFQSHAGNQRMLRLVDNYRNRYLEAERKEKHVIIERLIKTIRKSGGRFLSRVGPENHWVEVSHSIAYRKVGHAFRSKVRTRPGVRSDTASLHGNHDDPPPESSLGRIGSSPSVSIRRAPQNLGFNQHAQYRSVLPTGTPGAVVRPGRDPSTMSMIGDSQLGVSGGGLQHHVTSHSTSTSRTQISTSSEINQRIYCPPERLAVLEAQQQQFPLQNSTSIFEQRLAATAGLSSLRGSANAPAPASPFLGAGLLPSTTAIQPAMRLLYQQQQWQQLAQQQRVLLASGGGNNMLLTPSGDHSSALLYHQRGLIPRAQIQFAESYQRNSLQHQRGDRQHDPTQRTNQQYQPFSGK